MIRWRQMVVVLGVGALTACSTQSHTSGRSSSGTSSSTTHACPSAPAANTDAARGINASVLPSTIGGYGHAETDVRSENLDLHWNGTTLDAKATLSVAATKRTQSLSLDLQPNLAVTKATFGGRAVTVNRSGHTITVATGTLDPGQARTLEVSYRGTPSSVKAPTTRSDNAEGLGWLKRPDGSITTYAEPYGTSTWAPVNETPDDKALFSGTVTTPRGTVGLLNGSECSESTSKDGSTRAWRAREPMPAYLVSLDIGDYRPHPISVAGRTVMAYLRPADQDLLPSLQRDVPWAYQWLTSRLGAYPFSQLSLVVTDGESAMETQGFVSFGRTPVVQDSRGVVLHEFSHQWFGDEVTPRSWNDLWLSEGSAMFAQFQGAPGPGTSDMVVQSCKRRVAEEGQVSRPSPGHFAEATPYLCGATMLSELRDQVGDTAFWKAMAGWARSRPFGTATREDFARYWQKATGKDPRPTLAKWFDDAGPSTSTGTQPINEAAASSASQPDAMSSQPAAPSPSTGG